jgi:hypothetical protein
MYVYRAYELGIHSEIQLPELIAQEVPADVIVRWGKLANDRTCKSNGGDYFLGEVPELGTFLVKAGREIVIDPLSGVDEAVLRTLILGPILCILLRQRGLLVLHASGFASNEGAVAFIGESGWGKSTLVEAFHACGYGVLTDDVMAIDIASDRPHVLPGYPQVKLWDSAAKAIGHVPESLPLLHSQTQKRIHRLTHSFHDISMPLQRIYVLDRGDRHAIMPLEAQAGFLELVRHSRAVSLLTSPEFQQTHFQQCVALAKSVPICRLQRQFSLAALPTLVKLIEADLNRSSVVFSS